LIRKEGILLERKKINVEEQLLCVRERFGSFYKNKTKYLLRERVGGCYYKNKN